MDVTPRVGKGKNIIHSYAGGRIKVGENVFDRPVIVTPDSVIMWDIVVAAADLQAPDFEPLAVMKGVIDVILLGCGKTMVFLKPDVKLALSGKGLNVDVMDTGAACRTYNVLMAEGRRVAAALIPA